MTIDTHEAITVSIRAVRMDRPRTLAEYQADVARRYGGKLPDFETIAARESRAMRKAIGTLHSAHNQAVGSGVCTPEMRQKLSDAAIRKAQLRMEALLATLTRAKSVETICQETGWPAMTVRRALNRAQLEGRAVMVARKPFQIWERRA